MKISRGFCVLATLAAVAGCSKGELVLEGDRQDLRSAVIGSGAEADGASSLAPKAREATHISSARTRSTSPSAQAIDACAPRIPAA